ncbi:MAG TPA: acyl-CoA thioesterase [Myxococcota bacterium]|nr:acyl-CoA thioesterase [Myxococcota bacterium]
MQGVHEFRLQLPRHAFGPDQYARPGEIWRLFQEAAVRASTECGWPPQRYAATETAFVVTAMTTRHEGRIRYGDDLLVVTWLRDFRRRILTKREIRLYRGDELAAETTQQWAHVAKTPSGMAPAPATDALIDAFHARDDLGPVVDLPALETREEHEPHTFSFQCWRTWMDPLGHANHPAYLDWCDEAVARMALARGASEVIAYAERVHWKGAVVAGEQVHIETTPVGKTRCGASVLRHVIRTDAELKARATTIRRFLHDG